MAIYHLAVKIVSRGQGHSATAAAAYRARGEIVDERTGKRHDYSNAYDCGADLLFEGIYRPRGAPAWTGDRAALWNHVEMFEKRKDAQLAREFEIALPHELTDEQNRWLVQDFVRENFTRRGYVADVAIHSAHEYGDARNAHAHVLTTLRRIEGEEFAATKDRDLNSREQIAQWRESWERHANHHLARHGHDARIDRRTLEEQGIDRAPQRHLGKAAAALERDGIPTEAGDHNREAARHGVAQTGIAADMRALYELAETPSQFTGALWETGLVLAQVTAADLAERARREADNESAPPLPARVQEGDFVAVSRSGYAYLLNRRATGEDCAEAADFFNEFEGVALSVGQARAVAREMLPAYFEARETEHSAPSRWQDGPTDDRSGRDADAAASFLLGSVTSGGERAVMALGGILEYFCGMSTPERPQREAQRASERPASAEPSAEARRELKRIGAAEVRAGDPHHKELLDRTQADADLLEEIRRQMEEAKRRRGR